MTLFPDKPDDFQDYLREANALQSDPNIEGHDGQLYAQRSAFGDYIAARVRPMIDSGRIEHWHTAVASVTPEANGYRLRGYDGRTVVASLLVLAVSHPSPALPREMAAFADDEKLIGDVTVPGALAPIAPTDRVLIVGNGLTSADVVASLERTGHRGPIVSISRRGLRSRGHGPAGQGTYGDFLEAPSTAQASFCGACGRPSARPRARG